MHARRQAMAFINDKDVVKKLFDEIAPRFATRPGGYTRIIKLGPARRRRRADGAARAGGARGVRRWTAKQAPAADGRRIAVLLEYDGTAYSGSQYQENGPSIQSELEAAISKLTGGDGARGIRGTHRRRGPRARPGGQLRDGIEADAGGVRERAEPLPAGGHRGPAAREVARGVRPEAARARTACTATGSTTGRCGRRWSGTGRGTCRRPLDVAAMQRAARLLEGKHDFAAFAGAVRRAHGADAAAVRSAACGGHVTVEMEAQAFLPHQVRRTVGPLVEVGLGRMTEEDAGGAAR